MNYIAKTFETRTLQGISPKNIEEHIGLYNGYVKHYNLATDLMGKYVNDSDAQFVITELNRRRSFEYNGIKNHEYYFTDLLSEQTPLDPISPLAQKMNETWGGYDGWRAEFEKIALTRGIGWAILSYDSETGILQNGWVDEQHLGQLNSTQYIIGIDMWEHAYVADYQPSGKKQYVADFLDQVSWTHAMERFNQKTAQ
jgi:superoxide dismutase, Fe-Mn family